MKLDKRRFTYALIIAVALSVPAFAMLVLQSPDVLKSYSCLGFLPGHPKIAGCVLSAVAIFGGLPFFYVVLGALPKWKDSTDNLATTSFLTFELGVKSVLVTALIIIVFWSPYFVMYFPGITTGFDTISQLFQFFTPPPTYVGFTGEFVDADFLNDNPVFDTLVFGGFVYAGRLLGSDMLGMFLYCFTQAVFAAAAFSVAVCYLRKLGAPRKACYVALGFVCIVPIFPVSAYSMIKDSLFSIVFLLYVVCYIEVFRTKGTRLKSTSFLVVFVVFASLCCLTKTTGLYVIVPSGLVLAIAVKGSVVRRLIAAFLPYVICALVIPTIVFPVLNVGTASARGISVPGSAGAIMYQQVITVAKKHPKGLSADEKAAINDILDFKNAKKRYNPHELDPVAKTARAGISKEQQNRFIQVWAELGLRYPKDYITSQAKIIGTLVVPSANIRQEQGISQKGINTCSTLAARVGNEFHLDAANPAATHVVAEQFNTFYNNVVSVVPGISLFMTSGLYGGWIPFTALLTVWYFSKKRSVALTPIVLTALILLVCPSPLARYIMPSVYIAIPTIGWCIYVASEPK